MTATQRDYTRLPEQLLFRREVAAWMEALVDKDGTHPHAPKTREDVYKDVVELWKEKGFLDANELKRELALKYTKNASSELKDVIHAVHSYGRERDVDELSGGLRKTHLDTLTGLGQLYSIEMNEPVALMELDYSNMGGTNQFFKMLIAEERGIRIDQVEDEEAEVLTDRCAKIIANTIRRTIHEATGLDNEICVRAGGDELRFIIPDLDIEKYPRLQDDIHSAIQDVTARLGMHDHTYLKEPDNMYKSGFGAAIDVIDMRSIQDKATDLKNMDDKIKTAKVRMGYERLGHVATEILEKMFWEKIKQDPDAERLTEAGQKEHVAIMVREEQYKAEARLGAFEVYKAGKDTNADPRQRLSAIVKEIECLESLDMFNRASHLDVHRPGTNDLLDALEAGGISSRLYESMEERLNNAVNKYLYDNSVELNAYERQVLNNTLSILSPIDPVTKTWLDRDLPATTEIYMNDSRVFLGNIVGRSDHSQVQRFFKGYDLKSENLVDQKPQGMRFAFHNLSGLNKLLGQNGANAVLESWAQDIIKESLHERGFEEHEHYRIAHYGGGEFQVIIPPVVGIKDFGFVAVNDVMLSSVAQRVTEKTEELNRLNVSQYLKERDITVEDLPEDMDFFQVPNGNKERWGWGDGLFVSVVKGDLEASEHSTKTPGGSALYAQKKALEEQVDIDRDAKQKLWNLMEQKQDRNGGMPWANQEIS